MNYIMSCLITALTRSAMKETETKKMNYKTSKNSISKFKST